MGDQCGVVFDEDKARIESSYVVIILTNTAISIHCLNILYKISLGQVTHRTMHVEFRQPKGFLVHFYVLSMPEVV